MSHQQQPLDWLKALHQESYLWSLCCCGYDEELAKDVLQNAYLKVIEQKARYSGKAKRKTWFFSVIKYTAIDSMRQRRLHIVPVAKALHMTEEPSSLENDSSNTSNFKQILQELSIQQREILTLVFYNDLSIEAAAKVLNMKLGTARTHYSRGKENFKKKLLSLRSNKQVKNEK